MRRSVVVWAILLRIPLTGVWMVCGDAPLRADQRSVSPEQRQESADCTDTCATLKPTTEEPVCLLLPDAQCLLAVAGFDLAVLRADTPVLSPSRARRFTALLPAGYSDPDLDRSPRPPRA